MALREVRPLSAVRRHEEGRVVMQWGDRIPADDDENEEKDKADKEKKELVVSGGVKGADEIEGKPAILDIPTGRGWVVAFDFRPRSPLPDAELPPGVERDPELERHAADAGAGSEGADEADYR